ncbi:hypothetical protein ASG01_14820 [Chryseobacterium sp. Leaf180]|uniref:hypothetical protein n=1 Tax=Chryseobacterium sp. Leaf180 TaxID=1736289 RepID=UPI0006F2E50E|nr:hypothetical protein [Chryseobacterium sp. Leaf180]KQR90835.1 hypothetical protein ASG01_14820 [Chryseobacterium sp. Leaf180]
MKKFLLLLIIIFSAISCGEECYNAPQPVVFQIVDADNKNLLTNGTLMPYAVKDENQKAVTLTPTEDGKLLLENVGAFNGTRNYTFSSAVRNFEFAIEAKEFNSGCTGFQIKKITFTGINIDVKDENGTYRIIFK